MTFRDWQQLPPGQAAREVHRRAMRLSAAQQRAVLAALPSENELATRFAAAARPGPLAGVPFMVKDIFDLAGVPTRAGSTFLTEIRPTPTHDAALVQQLTRQGAVVAGKTHTHEFAYGITGENPHFGDCEHPHFAGRTTGGSSSGSAAVVAAGIVPLAIGSDTGGSVRVPAAFCDLFGFRLMPHDAWIRDAFPLAPSFDTAGWFTQNAADMRATLQAFMAQLPADRTPRGLYLELPGLETEIATAFRSGASELAAPADAAARDELLAGFAPALESYHTIVAAEAWEVHRPWAERHRSDYGRDVWDRVVRGRDLPPGQLPAARRTVETVRRLWASFFQTYDFLILPASACVAPTKAGCTLELRRRLLGLTAPASLGGLPVLTLPIRLPSGLSTGLQVVVDRPQSPALEWALGQVGRE